MCYIAVKYNQKSFLSTYGLMVLFSLIPTWSLAAYYSNNLIFDSNVYDLLLVVSSVIFFMLLGESQSFTWINYVGVALSVIGILLIKVKL